MHQNSQIVKNYGQKIDLPHDEFDLQFIKPENGFMRKHLIQKQAHRLDYMLTYVSTPISTKTRTVNRAPFISQALRFHMPKNSKFFSIIASIVYEKIHYLFRNMHHLPYMRANPTSVGFCLHNELAIFFHVMYCTNLLLNWNWFSFLQEMPFKTFYERKNTHTHTHTTV